MRHIPNILSLLRLVLVGVFVHLFRAGKYVPALCVFIFAFYSDILDGQLARKNGWISDLGKLLDPLADKIMTIAALICIYAGKRQPIYLVLFLLVFIKELLMLIGGLLLAGKRQIAYAQWPGKLATGLFAVGVLLSLVSFISIDVAPWDIVLLCAATALSYYAFFYYAFTQGRSIFQNKGAQDEQRPDADCR